ncbi:MAG: hypothetical protein RI967_1830 [Planctomycetota bacterium]|jgi:uncharacterized protein YbjQ (UPF0145 family)
MEALLGLLCNCALPLALIAIGFGVGTAIERSHLASLARREEALRGIVATTLRTPPADRRHCPGRLVSGSAVIGSDYFKTFAASLRNLVGGEVRSFERMMQRARREAYCRMLEEARAAGADLVINVRYETSSIGAMGGKAMPMAEVVAYGTAILPAGAFAR